MPIASTDVDPWPAWDAISLLDPASPIGKDLHLYAVGCLRTEINNGGFHQLFWSVRSNRSDRPIPVNAGTTDQVDRLGDDWLHESDSLDNEHYALEAAVDLDAAMRSLLS